MDTNDTIDLKQIYLESVRMYCEPLFWLAQQLWRFVRWFAQ
ncbi:MAG: hypothetical protein V4805_05825 [Pseudomonadota bacterium]